MHGRGHGDGVSPSESGSVVYKAAHVRTYHTASRATPQHLSPARECTRLRSDVCGMFTAALLVTHEIWKQLKCPSRVNGEANCGQSTQ